MKPLLPAATLRDRSAQIRTEDSKIDELIRQLEKLEKHTLRRKLRTPPNRYTRFLYKYRPGNDEYLKDIIINNRLWLSSPSNFNDPFDACINYNFSGTSQQKLEAIKRILKSSTTLSYKKRKSEALRLLTSVNWNERFQESYDSNIRNLGVCSFSETPRNILMWSHYADHHRGVCIQYCISQSLKPLLGAIAVKYTNDYLVGNPAVEDQEKIITRSLLTKAADWAYEHERRILIPDRAGTTLFVSPPALRSVIIGCKASVETINLIESLLKERRQQGFPDFKIYQAAKDPAKFALKVSQRKVD